MTLPAPKVPIRSSVILKVGVDCALVLTSASIREGAVIQVELDTPLCTPAQLVSSRVLRAEPAPNALLPLLYRNGKGGGTLLSVEFLNLPKSHANQLKAFVAQRAKDGNEQHKDVAAKLSRGSSRLLVPAWCYALGLFGGAYALVTGIIAQQSDTVIATHALLALAGAWIVGRSFIWLWKWMEAWRSPEAIIVGVSSGILPDSDEAKRASSVADTQSPMHDTSHDVPNTLPFSTEAVSAPEVAA